MTGGFDFRKTQGLEDLKEWFVGQIGTPVKEFLENVEQGWPIRMAKGHLQQCGDPS